MNNRKEKAKVALKSSQKRVALKHFLGRELQKNKAYEAPYALPRFGVFGLDQGMSSNFVSITRRESSGEYCQ